MSGHVVAAVIAREATRRHLFEPQPVSRDRRHTTAAVLLQRAAHRLDPSVAGSPRAQVQG